MEVAIDPQLLGPAEQAARDLGGAHAALCAAQSPRAGTDRAPSVPVGRIARQRPVPLLHFFPLQLCWAAKHNPITRLARSLALTHAHLGPLFPCYPSLQAARDADGLFRGADALIIDSSKQ